MIKDRQTGTVNSSQMEVNIYKNVYIFAVRFAKPGQTGVAKTN